jgi:hypothetical protein
MSLGFAVAQLDVSVVNVAIRAIDDARWVAGSPELRGGRKGWEQPCSCPVRWSCNHAYPNRRIVRERSDCGRQEHRSASPQARLSAVR